MAIYFYSTQEEYGAFSNFSRHAFELDGLVWSTSDQLDWQAGGFFFSLFRSAGEPGKDYQDELLEVVGSMK
jgi:hypothetical protein